MWGRGDNSGGDSRALLFTTIKVPLLCPGFTSLQAKHSHKLITTLKFMKITSVIFSRCLPCSIHLYITTVLNQLRVEWWHDYIEARRGRRGEEEDGGGERVRGRGAAEKMVVWGR